MKILFGSTTENHKSITVVMILQSVCNYNISIIHDHFIF